MKFLLAYIRDEELVPHFDSSPDELNMYLGLERKDAPCDLLN